MAILSCHVSIKLPPKISDGQENSMTEASRFNVRFKPLTLPDCRLAVSEAHQ